jgi:hypothetical protein
MDEVDGQIQHDHEAGGEEEDSACFSLTIFSRDTRLVSGYPIWRERDHDQTRVRIPLGPPT